MTVLYIANWATSEDAAAQNDDRNVSTHYLAEPRGVIVMDREPETIKCLLDSVYEEHVNTYYEDLTEMEVPKAEWDTDGWSEELQLPFQTWILKNPLLGIELVVHMRHCYIYSKGKETRGYVELAFSPE